MNKLYYKLLARVLLYKFNKFRFQGKQKNAFKKRLMRHRLSKAGMNIFCEIHSLENSCGNKYLISTGSYLKLKTKKVYK
jgi:hypothetical protein